MSDARETLERFLKMTGKRTHERTFQTMLSAGKIILVLTALYFVVGCNMTPLPYSASYADNPQEQMAAAYVMSACMHLGIDDTQVIFSDDPPQVSGECYEHLDDDKMYSAAAWALVGDPPLIAVWPDAPGIYTVAAMTEMARHECCHIKLGHKTSNPEDEAAAQVCIKENWNDE